MTFDVNDICVMSLMKDSYPTRKFGGDQVGFFLMGTVAQGLLDWFEVDLGFP